MYETLLRNCHKAENKQIKDKEREEKQRIQEKMFGDKERKQKLVHILCSLFMLSLERVKELKCTSRSKDQENIFSVSNADYIQ